MRPIPSGHRRLGFRARLPGVRASGVGDADFGAPRWSRRGALPVEQRGVNVQVFHGHLNAPVCVAGRRHGAGRAAAQVAQVGELVVRDGGQGAADGLLVHGSGWRGHSGKPVDSGSARRSRGSTPCASRVGRPYRLRDTRSRGRPFPAQPTPSRCLPGAGADSSLLETGQLCGGRAHRGRASSLRPGPPRRCQPPEPACRSSSLPRLLRRRQRRMPRRG